MNAVLLIGWWQEYRWLVCRQDDTSDQIMSA
jgi:hypothetical protein